jgi:hypothetical protein
LSQTFKKGREGTSHITPKKNHNEGSLGSEGFNLSPIKAPNSNHKMKHTISSNKIDSSSSKSNISGLEDLEERKYDDPSQEIAALKEKNTLLRKQLKINIKKVQTL